MNKGLIIAFAVVALAAVPDRGEACSRTAMGAGAAPVDPRALVVNADAAFVGTLLDVRPLNPLPAPSGPGPHVGSSDQLQVFTFEVEERFKGDLPTRVEVISYVDGGFCGLSATAGRRVGLLLNRSDGVWKPASIDEVDAETLRQGARPLPNPDGSGRAAMLVGGNFGEARLATLDAAGNTLKYGWGRGGVVSLSVCPRAQIAVELVRRGTETLVGVRALPSLALLRTAALPSAAYGSQVVCRDTRASDLLVAGGEFVRGTGSVRGVAWRVTPIGTSVLERGERLSVAVRGEMAFVSSANGQLVARNLVSGARRIVARTRGLLTGMSVSPDRSLVAGFEGTGFVNEHLVVANVVKHRTKRRPLAAAGQTAWLDGRTLMASYWRPTAKGLLSSRSDLFDISLRPRGGVSWPGRVVSLSGNSAYGMTTSGILLKASAIRGNVVPLGEPFSPAISALAALTPT